MTLLANINPEFIWVVTLRYILYFGWYLYVRYMLDLKFEKPRVLKVGGLISCLIILEKVVRVRVNTADYSEHWLNTILIGLIVAACGTGVFFVFRMFLSQNSDDESDDRKEEFDWYYSRLFMGAIVVLVLFALT